ncbi:S8 family serine peptidase [Streptomyces niger]|uniref:S8 family serine peptidase n=1 Tax=Streptomyces niger TaxID=66373 RepID=UPI0018FE97F1|nr:S8 family serine peptidase [Streptomyces niger]
MRDRQWYLDRMQAERMWEVSTGKGVTVAVLDGGVDSSARELTGKVLEGKNFVVPGKSAEEDEDGHGTAMAMLISGNGAGGQGIQGLAPSAKILPLTVVDSHKKAKSTTLVERIASAIRYAADSEAKVINMSVGEAEYDVGQREQRELQSAVDYAIDRGKLLMASAGNSGDKGNVLEYPAGSAGVAGISAVNQSLTATKYSNTGPQVALAAPGEDIPIRCKEEGGYCRSGGTSQATAIASGAAALIWSKHPGWTGNQVLRVMMESAGRPKSGKVPSPSLGYGTTCARCAVLDNKGTPGPADVNPLVEAKTSASPSPSASAGATDLKKDAPSGGLAADSSREEGSNAAPWIVAGLLVVGLAAGAAGFHALRRKSQVR